MSDPAMGGPITELVVPYDLEQIAQRKDRSARMLRGRLISLAITIAVVIAFALWLRSQGQLAGLWISAVIIAASAAWAGVWVVLYRRARRELSGAGAGTAIRIDRTGVEVGGQAAGWPEVASLAVVKGGLGRSPRLQLTRTDGQSSSVALNQVDVMPATLDSVARAFSAGRHGVDLTALDA